MRRNRAVANGAMVIFDDLWREIVALVKEAKEKGLSVFTNGTPFERIVCTSLNPSTEGRRELRISLCREPERISVSGLAQSIEFLIEEDDNRVVCLKWKEKPISIEKAARLILEPFLFPELQPRGNG